MSTTSSLLKSYATRYYSEVDGWLGSDTIAQVLELDRAQQRLGLSGHVGEIGVHHGKLFILLYLLTQASERAVAVDIFDQQELNLDQSGQGSLAVLRRNLERFAGGTSKLRLVSADSTTIGAQEVVEAAGGPLRFLSIDGGHLSHIVRHDLNTAAGAICEGGVIILDDYFNPEFPGVSEGTNRYFLQDNSRGLVPFFVAMNKIYITTQPYAMQFVDHFTRLDLKLPYDSTTEFRIYDTSSSPIRITRMFGASVLSYSPDRYNTSHRAGRAIASQRLALRTALSNSVAWRHLRNTSVAGFVRRVADKIVPY